MNMSFDAWAMDAGVTIFPLNIRNITWMWDGANAESTLSKSYSRMNQT